MSELSDATNIRVDLRNLLYALDSGTAPDTVIFEYLQNASDAGAKHFTFSINDEALVMEHDGVPFNADDMTKFRTLYGTTKYFQKGNIGGFGRGARSALSFCRELLVESGPYRLCVLPDELLKEEYFDENSEFRNLTRFTLIYRPRRLVKSSSPFQTPTDGAFWLETLQRAHNDLIVISTTLGGIYNKISNIFVRSKSANYKYSSVNMKSEYVIKTNFYHDDNIRYEILYEYRSKETPFGTLTAGEFLGKVPHALADGVFSTGLPMREIPTRAQFYIDGPFRPDQSRRSILTDRQKKQGAENRVLIREAARLAADWIVGGRTEWILSGRLAETIPNLALRGNRPGAVFITELRGFLEKAEVFPVKRSDESTIEWSPAASIGNNVLFDFGDDTGVWPIPSLTPTRSNSVQALADGFNISPTSLKRGLEILADMRDPTFHSANALRKWQADVVTRIKALRGSRERQQICDVTLFSIRSLISGEEFLIKSAQEIFSQASPESLSQLTLSLMKYNESEFVNLFRFGDVVGLLLEKFGDKKYETEALLAIQDGHFLSQIGKTSALQLAQAPIWENLDGKSFPINELFDGSDLPENLLSVSRIRDKCIRPTFREAAKQVAAVAEVQLCAWPPLVTLCGAIRDYREDNTASADVILLSVAETLLKHYDRYQDKKAPATKQSFRTLHSPWVPISWTGARRLVRVADLFLPSAMAKSVFGELLPFPPFGTDEAWSTTGALLLSREFHMVDISQPEGLFAVIDVGKDRRFTVSSKLVLETRRFIKASFPAQLDKLDEAVVSQLAVTCGAEPSLGLPSLEHRILPLSQGVTPVELPTEWRQRTNESLARTITIPCWELLSARESMLCARPAYLEEPRRFRTKGVRLIFPEVPQEQKKDLSPVAGSRQPASSAAATSSTISPKPSQVVEESKNSFFGFLITAISLGAIYFLVTFKQMSEYTAAVSAAALVIFAIYVGSGWIIRALKEPTKLASSRSTTFTQRIFRTIVGIACVGIVLSATRRSSSVPWLSTVILLASAGIFACGLIGVVHTLRRLRNRGFREAVWELLAAPRWSKEILIASCFVAAVELLNANTMARVSPAIELINIIRENLQFVVFGTTVIFAIFQFNKIKRERAHRKEMMEWGLLSVVFFAVFVEVAATIFRNDFFGSEHTDAAAHDFSSSVSPELIRVVLSYLAAGAVCMLIFVLRVTHRKKDYQLGDAVLRWRIDRFLEKLGAIWGLPEAERLEKALNMTSEERVDPLMYPYYVVHINDKQSRELLKQLCIIEVKNASDGSHATNVMLTKLHDKLAEEDN